MGGNGSKAKHEGKQINVIDILNEKQRVYLVSSVIRHHGYIQKTKNPVFLGFKRKYDRYDPECIDRKQSFALKLLRLDGEFGEEDFQREMTILNFLHGYSQIIKYETPLRMTIQNVNFVLIPMKFYYQTDLYSYMTTYNFRFTESFICSITYQALVILHILKLRKIVHNDIKFQNFIIEKMRPFTIILTDFETSQILQNDQKSNLFHGTIIFQAPEVLRDEPHDYAADIWSLAVNVYYFLFGKFPFSIEATDDEGQILAKIEENRLERPNTDVSDDAWRFVSRALELDPDRRVKVEKALEMEWFAAIYEANIKMAANVIDMTEEGQPIVES